MGGDVVYCDGPYSFGDGSDGVVFNLVKQRMACPLLIDLRNIYFSDEMERHGLEKKSGGLTFRPGRTASMLRRSLPSFCAVDSRCVWSATGETISFTETAEYDRAALTPHVH